MNSRLAWQPLTVAALLGASAFFGGFTNGEGRAAAQSVLDDDDTTPPETSSPSDDEALDPNRQQVGVGLRLRSVMVPRGLLELFVEEAPGGSSKVGFGLELVRRKGNFEVQFGLEYDTIEVATGNWLDKGDSSPQDEVDHVVFDGFGWVSAEVTFINHSPIIPQLAIRYGGGAGIAVIKGEVRRTDYQCPGPDIQDDNCGEVFGAENQNEPYDIPPVMLIVNAIIGVQIKPVDKVFINVEGGLRTIPFFGVTAGYYF